MDIINCEVKFRCPKTWASLQDEGDPLIRFCSSCNQHVFLCKTEEDVQRHAMNRHCVAFFKVVEEQIVELIGDFDCDDKPQPLTPTAWSSFWNGLCFWKKRT